MAPMLRRAHATFWDWIAEKYPPQQFKYQWQGYVIAIAATTATAPFPSGQVQIQYPLFIFEFRAAGFIAGPAPPGVAYRIGIGMQSGSVWTQNQQTPNNTILSEIVGGDGRTSPTSFLQQSFAWPREAPPTTQLTVQVQNNLGGAVAMTLHAGFFGIEVRRRESQLGQAIR